MGEGRWAPIRHIAGLKKIPGAAIEASGQVPVVGGVVRTAERLYNGTIELAEQVVGLRRRLHDMRGTGYVHQWPVPQSEITGYEQQVQQGTTTVGEGAVSIARSVKRERNHQIVTSRRLRRRLRTGQATSLAGSITTGILAPAGAIIGAFEHHVGAVVGLTGLLPATSLYLRSRRDGMAAQAVSMHEGFVRQDVERVTGESLTRIGFDESTDVTPSQRRKVAHITDPSTLFPVTRILDFQGDRLASLEMPEHGKFLAPRRVVVGLKRFAGRAMQFVADKFIDAQVAIEELPRRVGGWIVRKLNPFRR